jgi:Fe-S oxidoreductase
MAVASRTYCIDEYMIRPDRGEKPRILRVADHISNKSKSRRVLLHGHCYLKAKPLAVDGFPTGVKATIDMLEAVGYQMELIEAGCCGMAGAFGYEAEHYDVSMRVGELGLFPYIRKSDPNVIIAAAGVSCQAQIQDGTKRSVVHPITLLE